MENFKTAVGNVEEKLHMKEFKYLIYVAVFFVSVLLISNVASSKILTLWKFDFDGGTILFPLSYIFGDILTEVYGYKRTRPLIWMGMAMCVLMAAVFIIVGKLPPSAGWDGQSSYEMILGWTPRIVGASVVAYFCGEFLNSYVLAKLKVVTNGKWLWLRTITSTLVGEGADTLIFVAVAFWGVLPEELLIAVVLSNYIFKVGVEVLFTPFTYLIVRFLKKSEGIDVYDRGTNFNPFAIK